MTAAILELHVLIHQHLGPSTYRYDLSKRVVMEPNRLPKMGDVECARRHQIPGALCEVSLKK